MVSKEGFDDESKPLRTVFVWNFPLKIKKKRSVKEFGKFGEVESMRILSFPIVDVSFIWPVVVLRKNFEKDYSDHPEDTMVSKEGFDDESKPLRTVFVWNFPLKIKKKRSVKEFGKFGEVESMRILSFPIVDGKISRKITRTLPKHHCPLISCADHPEDTMVSKEGFDDESKPLRTVFVWNFPLKIKKKRSVKEFGKFGEVESMRILSFPIVDVSFIWPVVVLRKNFEKDYCISETI
ncbi:uncharacterized protein LOC142526017 [Primulina tabacum]|uniref:uncharacterized protein LOC142526017 n=1 Tax=Primulina tabacum TaxID=48773 RepID=UPI003F5AD901